MVWSHWERGSSPVDWCEENYILSPSIAEFGNTISNGIFFLLPPVLMHLFRNYGQVINPGIHLIWLLLIIVGICSAYFHATLSLVGQLLDELAILWVFAAGFSMFHPRRFYPKFLNGSRKKFSLLIGLLAILGTALSIWKPIVNAFVLMLLVIPAGSLLYAHMKENTCPRVKRLGVRSTAVLTVALACWIADRALCHVWPLNFLYLHAIWHILICIASYTFCVMFSYFEVKDEYSHCVPILKYWPRNDFELGIPYVSVKKSYKDSGSEI